MSICRLLRLMIIVGLTAGCATTAPVSPGPGPTTEASRPSSSPTPRPDIPQTPTVSEASPTPASRVTREAPRGSEYRPPAVEDIATPTPAELARADLAYRLNADIALVEVVSVVTREPDEDEMPCLTSDAIAEDLWGRVEEVRWIALSVKGNVHHYVALGDLVIYCDR